MTMCFENVLMLKIIVKVDDLSILPQKVRLNNRNWRFGFHEVAGSN